MKRTAVWIARQEPVFWLILAPWLLFPELSRPLTVASMACIPLLWLMRPLAGRPLVVRSPLNWPLLLLLVGLGAAVRSSPQPTHSASQATACLAGLGMCLALINGDSRWRRPVVGVPVLTAAGAVIASLSLVGTDWVAGDVPFLNRVAAGLPRVFARGQGFPPWLVASALAALLPVAVSFAAVSWRRARQPLMGRWQGGVWSGAVAVLAMLAVMSLTQARTAILVTVLAGLVLATSRTRVVGVLVTALAVTVGVLLLIGLFSGTLTGWMVGFDSLTWPGAAAASPWLRRLELWRNALYAVRDYPVSGVGLGHFGPVAWLNYPFEHVAPSDFAADARNLGLQAGVDLGAMGLVGFTWLAAIVFLMGWSARRRQTGESRVAITGLWLGYLAWIGCGTVTPILLWSAPGWLVWVVIGFLAGAWQESVSDTETVEPRRQWLVDLVGVGVVAATAVAALNSPLWSLNRAAQLLDRAVIFQDRRALVESLRTLPEAGDLPGALRRLALAHYESGHRAQSAQLFQKDDESPGYLASLSRYYMERGELERAEELALLGLEIAPGSGRLACLLGDVYRQEGDPLRAFRYYRRVPVEEGDLAADRLRLAECYFRLGMAQESVGWWAEAARSLGAATSLDPSQVGYWVERGQAVYGAAGELAPAVAALEEALQANPGSVELVLAMTDLYLASGRQQKALEWSETAVETAPGNPETWLRYARALRALEHWQDSQQALAEVLRLDPGNAAALELQEAWGSE